MNIGDKVEWVPSVDKHLEVKDGKYAWEHAIKVRDKLEVQSTEKVKEFLKRNKKRPEALKLLIPTKPQVTYPATVTDEQGDKLSLDIQAPGGITWHHTGVAVDESGAPGTCH